MHEGEALPGAGHAPIDGKDGEPAIVVPAAISAAKPAEGGSGTSGARNIPVAEPPRLSATRACRRLRRPGHRSRNNAARRIRGPHSARAPASSMVQRFRQSSVQASELLPTHLNQSGDAVFSPWSQVLFLGPVIDVDCVFVSSPGLEPRS